jgi:hypothetical protein
MLTEGPAEEEVDGWAGAVPGVSAQRARRPAQRRGWRNSDRSWRTGLRSCPLCDVRLTPFDSRTLRWSGWH